MKQSTETKKSSALCRGRVHPVVPPQFTAKLRPYPIPADRKRNIGRTRLHLLICSAEPLRKEFSAVFLLPCTNRQFSGRKMIARTGFHHCVYFIKCTIFPWQSQREEPTTISKKRRAFLCILTWTLVRGRKNSRRHILKGHTIWCGLNNL